MRTLIEIPVSVSEKQSADKFADMPPTLPSVCADETTQDIEDAALWKLLQSTKPFTFRNERYSDGEHLRKCIRRNVFQQLRQAGATQSQARERAYTICAMLLQQLQDAAQRVAHIKRNVAGRPSAKADTKARPHARSKTTLQAARIIQSVALDTGRNALYQAPERISNAPEIVTNRQDIQKKGRERLQRLLDAGRIFSLASEKYRRNRRTIEEKDMERLKDYTPTYPRGNGEIRTA